MAVKDHVNFEQFMAGVERRNPHQTEFVQAVREVAEDIFEFIADKEKYHEFQILRRIAEPDRVISFRVCWEDDKGNIRVQRYRIGSGGLWFCRVGNDRPDCCFSLVL